MAKVRIDVPTNQVKFRSTFHKWRKILRAIFARLILCSHSWLAIYLASYIDKKYTILIGVSFLIFMLETGIILHCRSGLEWKRFCTPFFVYLITIVPTLWLLRLNPGYLSQHINSTATATNVTNTTLDTGFFLPQLGTVIQEKDINEEVLTSLVEQSMMFVIILCRWLLPRGHIDRNSLSQLLIMYSAIGADILDFSEILTEDLVQTDRKFHYAVLAVRSWSLLQFTLVVTTSFTFRRNVRKSTINPTSGISETDSVDKSEVLSILMVFLMQDGPFLAVRCYAIFELKMYQYLTIFFSLKNLLAMVLGLYRLVVICGCVEKEGNDLLSMEEIARSQESLDVISSPTQRRKNTKSDRKKKY